MSPTLYLDTARLGRTSPLAHRAQNDLARLLADEGFSLYFEEFLWGGFQGWPAALRRRYPKLLHWQGVAEFKNAIRSVLGAPADAEVLVAARSAVLMRLGARALTRRCRRVLVTDLSWPQYEWILSQEAARTGTELIKVALRDCILRRREQLRDVTARLTWYYRCWECDGAFLPAISHDGIRLYLPAIRQGLQHQGPLTFLLVDGAQACGHVPSVEILSASDFFVAGCHKWLAAGVPLGLAVCPRPATRPTVLQLLHEMLECNVDHDPLLSLIERRELGRQACFTETVDVAPLIAARATLANSHCDGRSILERFETCIANAQRVTRLAAGTGWNAVLPRPKFRSAALLLQPDRPLRVPADTVRRLFREQGLVVTVYENGTVRLAMPPESLSRSEWLWIRRALRSVAEHAFENYGVSQKSVVA